ncbi:MAG: AAA family ATPase [Oligoflexales bacterium]|nr:AAA family ATPase [Oligoflexales bacterium]
MTDKKIPKPEDIQKEFEDFVHKRFGKQVQIIAQEFPKFAGANNTTESEKKTTDDQAEDQIRFELKPKDIKEHLDRFVIGQDEAKKALSIAVCDHYNQIILHQKDQNSDASEHFSKQNVLISGPTGVGKTYMIKQIAKLVGVPFVKADATRFSETGYMGSNVDDLIKDLVNQADGNIEKAQYGIVYLDEADKLATSGTHNGRDVSGRGVQLGLLKLMEETEVDLRSSHDPASQMQAFMEMQQKGKVERQVINTKHILFIVSGAFTGLEDIVAKREKSVAIGFGQQEINKKYNKFDLLHSAQTGDYIKYGFEPEFIGRLPVRVACTPLDEEKLYGILKNSEGSILNQYTHAFRSYGIDLIFEDGALRELAKKASLEQTGARSLMTICEQIFRPYKFELPSTDIIELKVDAELVRNPRKKLQDILQNADFEHRKEVDEIRDYETAFASKHGMTIKFDQAACKLICQKVAESDIQVNDFCDQILMSFEHGLKLIQQNTGQNIFTLGAAVVEDPKQELERMVKDSYNQGL